MISLEAAAIINAEMTRLFNDGDSKFLTKDVTKQRTHEISKLMEELNSKHTFFSKQYIEAKDIIKSLKVDGEEVIGMKKCIRSYSYNYKPEEYYYKFYVDSENIISLATPASFGKGTETVLDENVRKALEIKEDRIEISYTNFDILSNKFNNFVPKNKKFVYKFHKMHIYTEGGKFTKHKDTIHGLNHYATLVVFIPGSFCGGELTLYYNDNIISSYSDSIMFLTNIDHEVKEVTAGTRIVLQYDVFLEDNCDSEENSENDEDYDEEDEEEDYNGGDCRFNKSPKCFLGESDYVNNLKKGIENRLLSEVDKFVDDNPDCEICFLLSQEYPLAINAKNLKSSDINLYETLSSKYNVELGYVVNNVTGDYEDSYSGTDILNVMSYSDKKRMMAHFDKLLGIETGVSSIKNKNKKEVHLFLANGNFKEVKSKHYIEHTGNEASPGEYSYVSIVLCLGERKFNSV